MMKIFYALCMMLPAVCSARWLVTLDDGRVETRPAGSNDLLEYLRANNTKIVSIGLDEIYDLNLEAISHIDFPALSKFTVRRSLLNRRDLQHLSQMNAPQLSRLELYRTGISDEAMRSFQYANFPQLRKFCLANNRLNSDSVEHFTNYENKFHDINLSASRLADEGAKYFSHRNFSELRHLELRDTQLGSKGVKYLTRAHLNALQELHLAQNTIANEGACHLSKGHFPELRVLDLYRTHLTGTQSLERGAWMKMESLRVHGNALEHFPCIQAEWSSMQWLNVGFTHESEQESKTLLQQKFNDCRIP